MRPRIKVKLPPGLGLSKESNIVFGVDVRGTGAELLSYSARGEYRNSRRRAGGSWTAWRRSGPHAHRSNPCILKPQNRDSGWPQIDVVRTLAEWHGAGVAEVTTRVIINRLTMEWEVDLKR